MTGHPTLPRPPGVDLAALRAALPPRADTERLGLAADICARARDALARRGHGAEGPRTLRRFALREVAQSLLHLDASELRTLLAAHPDWPQGRADTPGQRTFSLEDVNALRACLARTTGDAAWLPWRPQGVPAKIVALSNFKGGVAKTTTAAHLAMAAALDGYRVLVVDMDSQASLSTLFGAEAGDEGETAYAALARDYARHRSARDGTAALDEGLSAALDADADRLIKPTHWPTIDILPAQLNLYWAEFQVPVWLQADRTWPFWGALRRFLEDEGLLDVYDMVIVDTPPALGYLTINALGGSDILLIPVGASFVEFDSTGRFFDMLYTSFASIEESLAGVSDTPPSFEWDAVKVLLTRFDAAQQAEMGEIVEACLGDFMAAHRLGQTALIGQAGERVSGLYDADAGDFNRETYRRGRETFDATWAEVRDLVVGCWARDLAERDMEEGDAR